MNATAINSSHELTTWAATHSMPDLVIMDVRMWQRSGTSFATYFDRHYISQRLILTVTTQTIDSAQELQSAFFLLRPVRTVFLYDVLADLFGNLDASKTTEPWFTSLAASSSGKLADRHPLRILLTEDNIVNQKVLARMLERLGYIADIAHNGIEALTALHNKPYDVVLMDVHMPEMDGITATQMIRSEWEEDARPRIIALTADALEGDRENFLKQGLDDYLSKPVRIGDLVEKLLKCERIVKFSSYAY